MAEYVQVLKDIQSRKFSSVYFFQGEETFFIDSLMQEIEKLALHESERSFNQYVLYGKETSFEQIITTARKFPMMGQKQVILVKEAQEIRGWQKESDQNLLLNYLENPTLSTILAFAYKYKTLDKRTKLGKLVDKLTVSVLSKPIYNDKISGWILGYVKTLDASITNSACMLLAESIGNNLQRLANEIIKLLLNVGDNKVIDDSMVHKYVGISKEYNTFELQKAIGMRNHTKAMKIINFFAENPKNNPLILTLFSLYSYFSKLVLVHQSGDQDSNKLARIIGVNPSFINEYLVAARHYKLPVALRNLEFLYKADLESKGIDAVGKKEREILTELVFKLMC